MQPNDKRLLKAMTREGLHVTHDGLTYTVKLIGDSNAPAAEVLLPADLPLEAKAAKQLATLAAVRHPDGGCIRKAIATPDFHPGDAGIAIGSVAETQGIVIPQAIGTDINCGMRLHVADLTVDRFLSRKDTLVERLKGDYLMGTRDIVMTAGAMWAMFEHGVPAWVDAIQEHPMGNLARTDLKRIYDDVDRIALRGSLDGSSYWAPEGLTPKEGNVRDSGIATIGSGNHFVEVQVVEEVVDAALAYEWGVRKSQIAFMVHSGSRNVGMYVGKLWHEKARDAWPKGLKYPESRIFPLSYETTPDLVVDYLKAEATAANYAFVNRVLLAELMRIRLREVFGDIDVPLIYDIPHNITLPDGFPNVTTRKGACPAYDGQPVIIPGSMGTASFLCVGKGNQEFLCSASHGAGRSSSRGEMGRFVRDAVHATDLGLDGVECITLREERRIEEAPAAYKDISSVVNAQVQAGIIDVVARMKPILTFKA